MAGYIFSVSKDSWKAFCETDLRSGQFSPLAPQLSSDDLTPKKRQHNARILAAFFGDLITMKPGDDIFFLSNRKIYGLARAKQIGSDCKYDNYRGASELVPDCFLNPTDYLTTQHPNARWVVFFEPNPYFFTAGVDMDDVLSYKPASFRTLRAFQDVSFIKLDDEENRALKEYISLKNESAYDNTDDTRFPFDPALHNSLVSHDLSDYRLDITSSLRNEENKSYVFSEMLLEAVLLQQLTRGESSVLGRWDYLSQQLIASPFKPLAYIDKIDIFGYRFSEKYKEKPRLITKFLIVELKKGTMNTAAVEQAMQYVDWICKEYASGDYSRIEAYLVGERCVRNLEQDMKEYCQRSFISETHPVKTEKWDNLKIVTYSRNPDISFQVLQ